jgi:large subunit ribosomal protein L21
MSKEEMKSTKKAIIATGGHQYVVTEGETLDVELVGDQKSLTFEPLLVIDGDKTIVGTPRVKGASVTAKVVEEVKADKVTAIRYKAKKRVHKLHGHRQRLSRITISKIA